MGQEVKSTLAHLEKVFRSDVKFVKDDEIATRKAHFLRELQKILCRFYAGIVQKMFKFSG